jgi:hypothetical protein
MEAKVAKKRKYSRSAGRDVKNEMHRYKRRTAKSGPGGKGGRVKSRKQAIAIGLSEAVRKERKCRQRDRSRGATVPNPWNFYSFPARIQRPRMPKPAKPTAKVVNFMEALRKSLRKTPTVASSAHRRRRSA